VAVAVISPARAPVRVQDARAPVQVVDVDLQAFSQGVIQIGN